MRDVFTKSCVRQVPLKSLDQFYRQGCKFKGAYKVDKNIPSDINTLSIPDNFVGKMFLFDHFFHITNYPALICIILSMQCRLEGAKFATPSVALELVYII